MSLGIFAHIKELGIQSFGVARKDRTEKLEKKFLVCNAVRLVRELALCFLCQGPQGV